MGETPQALTRACTATSPDPGHRLEAEAELSWSSRCHPVGSPVHSLSRLRWFLPVFQESFHIPLIDHLLKIIPHLTARTLKNTILLLFLPPKWRVENLDSSFVNEGKGLDTLWGDGWWQLKGKLWVKLRRITWSYCEIIHWAEIAEKHTTPFQSVKCLVTGREC